MTNEFVNGAFKKKKKTYCICTRVPLFFPFLYFSADYSKHIFLENTKLYMSIYFLYDTDTIFYYKYGMYYG